MGEIEFRLTQQSNRRGAMDLELFEPLVASVIKNYDYAKFNSEILEIHEVRSTPYLIY